MLRGVGTLLRAVFGALRFTRISVCLGVRGDDPAAAARNYGKLQAWLYPTLGVLDHFFFLEFDQLRVLPDFGSAQLLCRTRCPSGSAHRRCSSSLPLCGCCTSSGG